MLWYCCGIDVEFLWDLWVISRGIIGECCDLAMASSWSCCVISRGILMVLLGDYSDTAMVSLWKCFSVKLLGDYWDIIIMVLLWDCLGIAVILRWDSCDCCGIAAGCLM